MNMNLKFIFLIIIIIDLSIIMMLISGLLSTSVTVLLMKLATGAPLFNAYSQEQSENTIKLTGWWMNTPIQVIIFTFLPLNYTECSLVNQPVFLRPIF